MRGIASRIDPETYEQGPIEMTRFGVIKRATGKGGSYINAGVEDVVFATLQFPNGVLAHLHVTWLSPQKIRQLTVVGDRRMM